MKNRIITYAILGLFLFSSLLILNSGNVRATDRDLMDWSTEAIGSVDGSMTYFDYDGCGSGTAPASYANKIANHEVLHHYKTYRLHSASSVAQNALSRVELNLNSNAPSYFGSTNLIFELQCNDLGTDKFRLSLYFKNASGNVCQIVFRDTDSNNKLEITVTDSDGAHIISDDEIDESELKNQYGGAWGKFFNIELVHESINSMYYNIYTFDYTENDWLLLTSYFGSTLQASNFTNFTQFDFQNLQQQGSGTLSNVYIDDLIVNDANIFEGDESFEYCNCDDNVLSVGAVSVGSWHPTHSIMQGSRTFLTKYNLRTSGTITDFYLPIENAMYVAMDADGTIYNDLILYLNGQMLGAPSEIIGLGSGWYTLHWSGIDLDVAQSKIYIGIYARSDYSLVHDSLYVLKWSSYDYNDDNSMLTGFIDDISYFAESDNYEYFPAIDSFDFTVNYDLVYKICIDTDGGEPIIQNLDNDLSVEPIELKVNEIFNVLAIQNKTSLADGNVLDIRIKQPDNVYKNYSYSKQYKSFNVPVFQEGDYNVSFYLDSVLIEYITVNATGKKTNTVFTYPFPTDIKEYFLIYYNYTYGTYGDIRVFDLDDRLLINYTINPESEGSVGPYRFKEYGNFVISLYSVTGVFVDSYVHICAPDVSASFLVQEIPPYSVRISGFNPFYIYESYVKEDNKRIRTITGNPLFSFEHELQVSSYHESRTFRLCYINNNTEVIIAVYDYKWDGSPDWGTGPRQNAFDEGRTGNPLTDNFNAILGTIIIVIFAVIGIGISSRLNSDRAVTLVIGIFALVGAIVTHLIGLIPMWILFLVALITILLMFREQLTKLVSSG